LIPSAQVPAMSGTPTRDPIVSKKPMCSSSRISKAAWVRRERLKTLMPQPRE
jgi:hypothetical protein